ncbi:TetR/AcrR family transcriptional regulator [Sphingomonas sp. GlSt437]|uniref:TetR/AcrR family transcriptional regulator n=1 Tax=Sphingomonas sp. GlSt437 TaxID=3389970 RepID=UPI003A863774
MNEATGRSYRGHSLAERQKARRAALIAAANAVYRRDGFAATTVRAICREAGLTERYFYEAFDGPHALLAATFADNITGLDAILRAAVDAAPAGEEAALRAVLRAYYGRLREDAAGARVFLVEIQGISPAIDAQFRAALRGFGQAMQTILPRLSDAPPLLADGLGGGTIQIALAWMADEYAEPLDGVVEAAVRLFAGVRGKAFGSPTRQRDPGSSPG